MAASVLLFGPAAAQDERTVSVSGEGRVSAVPDLAVVQVGVTTDAGTAAEALAANSAAMARVLGTFAAEGVEPRDLQTSSLSLGPRWADREGQAPVVEGYTARNVLSVRVRDLDRLGAILDAAAAGGEGANTFEGLSFGMDEPGALEDEALRLAVADARRKAELVAAEAGIALGAVQRIDTGTVPGPRPMDMQMARMAAAESVPVAQGELEIAASVSMVFAIGE